MDIFVIDYGQDDPAKCTSKKMARMGLATEVGRKFHASNRTIVLNPFAEKPVSPVDADSKAILVIDCSWNHAREVFFRKIGGKHRRIPALLAGNPVNYSRLGILSSVEAVAATLFIVGQAEDARKCLSIYKWGETFESLNEEPLKDYSSASSEMEIEKIEEEYFPQLRQQKSSWG